MKFDVYTIDWLIIRQLGSRIENETVKIYSKSGI